MVLVMAHISRNLQTADLSQRTQWYIVIRWFFLLAVAVPGIASLYVFEGWSEQVQRDTILALAALASNGLFYALYKLYKNPTFHTYLVVGWIILDIAIVTFLIFTKGGIESRSPILYTIPILMASAIFGKRATYVTAASCAIVYSSLIVADYHDVIQSVGAFDPTLRSDLPYVINTISFMPAVLLVVAMAVNAITSMLIEKQRQARNSLEELLRAQSIAKLGSWEWDINKNEVTWSDELFKIFGLEDNKPDKITYDSYLQYVHPDDVDEVKKAINRAIKQKRPFAVDHRVVYPDRSYGYIRSEGRPLLNQRGRVVKLAGTAQDVTEMHKLDDARQEFVSLASHQLRTPASGVKSFLSLLLDGYSDEFTKQQRKFIKKAYESNERQLDIIDNLLNLAAIESGQLRLSKKEINLNNLVSKSLPNHRPVARSRGQKISFTRSKEALLVNVDPNHLRMALDNLISNAIKYTPDKGQITVSVYGNKSSAYIDVADTGIGIPANLLPELFQKFRRLHDPASETVGGSGLGLYLAKYIVRLHGGSITVKSRYRHGTTFKIRLKRIRTNNK